LIGRNGVIILVATEITRTKFARLKNPTLVAASFVLISLLSFITDGGK
jgi:hypothetical protein